MTLREVHNTLAAPKQVGAGTKPETSSAAATPRSRPAFKVPKLLKSSSTKPVASENRPPTAKSSNGASCADSAASKAGGVASRRRVPSAPSTRESKAANTDGGSRKAPAAGSRAASKSASSAAAKSSSAAVATAPTAVAQTSTPQPLLRTPAQVEKQSDAGLAPQGRRRRAPPPQRYGQWVTGTPAVEADTPVSRSEAPSPLPLPSPTQAQSPAATEEVAGRHNAHWKPGLHSEEAARVAAMTQQAMAALLEAVPEEEEEVVVGRKGAPRQRSLQERLQQSWDGQSYYSRLKAMAGDAIEEEEEDSGKVDNVTDLLLKMNLTHTHNSRKSISATSVMSAVRSGSASPPKESVAKTDPTKGASKPSAAASAHVRGKSASRTAKAASKKDASATTACPASSAASTTAAARKGSAIGHARAVGRPARAKKPEVKTSNVSAGVGSGVEGRAPDVKPVADKDSLAERVESVRPVEEKESSEMALRAELAESQAALAAERQRVKELSKQLDRVGAEVAALRAEGERVKAEAAPQLHTSAVELQRKVAELVGLTGGLTEMAAQLC